MLHTSHSNCRATPRSANTKIALPVPAAITKNGTRRQAGLREPPHPPRHPRHARNVLIISRRRLSFLDHCLSVAATTISSAMSPLTVTLQG